MNAISSERLRKRGSTYIPALGYRILTPLYDVVSRTFLPEQAFKRTLIEQAAINRGDRASTSAVARERWRSS